MLAAPRESASAVTEATYLTAQQLADLLVVDPATVYRLAQREPTLPTLRIGGVVRFPKADVLEWLAAHTQGFAKPRRKAATVS